jgi:hypothetical protein
MSRGVQENARVRKNITEALLALLKKRNFQK